MSHSHEQKSIDTKGNFILLKIFLENWGTIVSLLGFLIMGVVAWTTLSFRTTANAEGLDDVRKQEMSSQSAFQAAAIQQASQFSQIQNDLSWIKNKLK